VLLLLLLLLLLLSPPEQHLHCCRLVAEQPVDATCCQGRLCGATQGEGQLSIHSGAGGELMYVNTLGGMGKRGDTLQSGGEGVRGGGEELAYIQCGMAEGECGL